MNKTGLELDMIAYILLGLVAVMLVISFYASQNPEFSSNMYCQLYQAVNAISIGEKPPVPAECGFGPVTERKRIGTGSAEFLAEKLTEHIIGCWNKSQKGTSGTTFVCFELYFQGVDGIITEEGVASSLRKRNFCSVLPDNYLDLNNLTYPCGDANKIQWLSDIQGSGTFIVKYDAFKRVVVVE